MLIHFAEDGRSFDLQCTPDTAVEGLTITLHALTGVPPADQLLICAGVRLEPAKTLSCYSNILSKSWTFEPHQSLRNAREQVFLYSRRRLSASSEPPVVHALGGAHVEEIPLPVAGQAGEPYHTLDNSPNPLLRALPSFERQFRQSLLQAQAYVAASQTQFETCRRLVNETRVQTAAVHAAAASMEGMGSHIVAALDAFLRSFDRQHAQQAQLLRSVPSTLDFLRACPLIPQVQVATGRRRLIDLSDATRWVGGVDGCRAAHEQMREKVTVLKEQYERTRAEVEQLMAWVAETGGSQGTGVGGAVLGREGEGQGEGERRSEVAGREGRGSVGESQLQEGRRLLEEQELIVSMLR